MSLSGLSLGTCCPFSVLWSKCAGRGFSTLQTGGWPHRSPQTPEPFHHSRSNPVKKMAVLASWGSLGQCGVENWDLKGPVQAFTQIFMNIYDPEQSQTTQIWTPALLALWFGVSRLTILILSAVYYFSKNGATIDFMMNVQRIKWGDMWKYLAYCQTHRRAQ